MVKSISETRFNSIFNAFKASYGIDMKSVVFTTAIGANKNIGDTAFDQQFVINASSDGFAMEDGDEGVRLTKSLIASISAYLSKNKVAKDDEATAFIITDTSGNFKLGAIIEYHSNDSDAEEPGNWSYAFTFDMDDITRLEKNKKVKKLIFDEPFKTIFDKITYDIASLQFDRDQLMYNAINLIINTLTQVLDAEAIEDETVDIEVPGYFVASVSVEDGEKIYALTPDGAMKMIIKDDSKLSDL